MTSSYQYGDILKCFDSMDGHLLGHRVSGASRGRIIWIIRGMSFAMKYLPAIRTIGAGKGQSAGETRNRNRRRKSMSGTPAWAIGGRWSEKLNDNDTFAEKTQQPG